MTEVQPLVDALAAELNRPVGVDDRRFRAVAYSSHPEQVDPVRVASILRREAPDEVRGWLHALAIETAETATRVPPNPDLGMAARICVPLRFDRTLLGYLWLIDEPEALTEGELESIGPYATEIAVALHRARRHDSDEREHELVARLLSREPAEGDAPDDEGLARSPGYAVIAITAVHEAGADVEETVIAHVADAVGHAKREANPSHMLADLTVDPALCILATASAEQTARRAARLADFATNNLSSEDGWRAVAAVSRQVEDVEELPTAAEQAREGLRIALAVGLVGPSVRWDDLGAYRVVGGLLRGRDPMPLLPASLRSLLESGDAEVLIPTLERYLDYGGDARAAAADLFVHRSSMYSRLRKIEEIAGVDLRSGEDRLELHLGLRLWRLAGPGAGTAS